MPPPERPATSETRSQRSQAAILAATAELLDEAGFASMTMEQVAARAGAGKSTVYRHWPTKGALAMDAVLTEVGPRAPFPDTGSAIEDFRVQVRAVARVFVQPRIRQTLIGIIFEAQGNPELRDAFTERYMAPRRAQAQVVIERGIRRGELRPGINAEVLCDQIYGALYFRLLVSARALNRRFTDELVKQAFQGLLP